MTTPAQPATDTLIRGGTATLFVSDLDRTVSFYTETLGLDLAYRAGEHYAAIDAGTGFTIGLHPPSPRGPKPGTVGAIQIGLNVTTSIESVVETLQQRGVQFTDHGQGPVLADGPIKLAFFHDPDGHVLYLCQSDS